MTDRTAGPPPAVAARILALGLSAGATLALMAGMAWAADHQAAPAANSSIQPGFSAAQPGLRPTQAPPVTSSHGS